MREGITVWTNRTAIKITTEFPKGIESVDNFIYFISQKSLQSKYCQDELKYALAHNKRIISLLVEDTDTEQIPPEIHTSQFIDFQEHQDEKIPHDSIEKLLKGLSLDAYYYEQHKIWLVNALKWERQNRNLSLLLRGSNLQRAQAWLNVAKQRTEHPPLPLHGEFIAESLRQLSDSSLDVFITYCRANSDFAQKLNEELQLQGKTTWFDQENIASDSDFQQEIKQGIEGSDNFLFIVSPSSANSPNWVEAVEYAQKLNKRFVPVLHREVATKDLHPALASVQPINFNKHGGDFSANFTELVRILDTDRDYVRNHTQLLQRVLKWNLKDKSTDLLLRGKELELAEQWLNEAEQRNTQPAATSLQKEFITKSCDATKNFFDIFISYGRPDSKEFVIKLHDRLVTQGLKVWLDKNDIPPAVDFQNQINDGIEKASNFLFIISPHSVNSDYCRKEIELANQLNKCIIPLLHVGEINEENWRKTWQPDGKTIASGSRDKTIRLWSVEGQLLHTLTGHTEGVTSVSFSPEGQAIVSASFDQTVKLWSVEGQLLQTFKGHTDRVISVSFSPNGQIIASASWDNTVKLWSAAGQLLHTLTGHNAWVKSVSFSPDGQMIASASDDKTVKLWNLKGEELLSLKGHIDGVNSISFSPNGQTIASASQDTTLILWNLADLKLDRLMVTACDWVRDYLKNNT